MMLTLLFALCMISVFGKLFVMSVRGAWGLSKIILTLVFFPIILIGMVIGKLFFLAFPILLIAGAVSLLTSD